MAIETEYWPTLDPSITAGSREQILEAADAIAAEILKRCTGEATLSAIAPHSSHHVHRLAVACDSAAIARQCADIRSMRNAG